MIRERGTFPKLLLLVLYCTNFRSRSIYPSLYFHCKLLDIISGCTGVASANIQQKRCLLCKFPQLLLSTTHTRVTNTNPELILCIAHWTLGFTFWLVEFLGVWETSAASKQEPYDGKGPLLITSTPPPVFVQLKERLACNKILREVLLNTSPTRASLHSCTCWNLAQCSRELWHLVLSSV